MPSYRSIDQPFETSHSSAIRMSNTPRGLIDGLKNISFRRKQKRSQDSPSESTPPANQRHPLPRDWQDSREAHLFSKRVNGPNGPVVNPAEERFLGDAENQVTFAGASDVPGQTREGSSGDFEIGQSGANPTLQHVDPQSLPATLHQHTESFFREIGPTFEIVGAAADKEVELMEGTGVADIVKTAATNLIESIPALLEALDVCASAYPPIAAAVIAFKTVYKLEMVRKDNDRHVIALYREMRIMMAAFLKIPEGGQSGGNSQTTALTTICKDVQANIKDCANVCNTYRQKRTLVKVIKGPFYAARLATCAANFAKRQQEIMLVLTVNTASQISDMAQIFDTKFKEFIFAFQQALTSEQQAVGSKVTQEIQRNGVIGDDQLRALLTAVPDEDDKPGDISHKIKPTHQDLEIIRKELRENIDDALEKNMVKFCKAYDVQFELSMESMNHLVEKLDDAVARRLNQGPYQQINDPDIQAVWKEMEWKGSVKARHFVLALRDHFTGKRQSNEDTNGATEAPTLELLEAAESVYDSGEEEDVLVTPPEPDDGSNQWTLKYLALTYLQGISEAFDNDSSGFVTVAEVNNFVSSRPDGWSVLKWIAYSAIGTHVFQDVNAIRIREIFDEMYSLVPIMTSENRAVADAYLNRVWEPITTFSDASAPCKVERREELQDQFKEYIDSQEKKLKLKLEAKRYFIADLGMLSDLIDRKRIEEYFIHLVKILLERHLQIFHQATREQSIEEDELLEGVESFECLLREMHARYRQLKEVFSHQAIDIRIRFKQFHFGLFEFYHSPDLLWSAEKVKKRFHYDSPSDDIAAWSSLHVVPQIQARAPEIVPDSSVHDAPEFQLSELDNDNFDDAPEPLRSILGTWNCKQSSQDQENHSLDTLLSYASNGSTLRIVPNVSAQHPLGFTSEGRTLSGESYTVQGEVVSYDERIINLKWRLTFPYNFPPPQVWRGVYDRDSSTVRGSWKFTPLIFDAEDKSNTATPKIITPSVDPGHVISRVSGEFTLSRPLDRAPPDPVASETLAVHSNYYCDSCHSACELDRVVCLDCEPVQGRFETINLCGDHGRKCLDARVISVGFNTPHLPKHRMVMLRRPLTTRRRFGYLFKEAVYGMSCAKDAYEAYQDSLEAVGSGIDPQAVETDLAYRAVYSHGPLGDRCWYCMDCFKPTLISLDYDTPGGFMKGAHRKEHSLLLYRHSREEVENMTQEERLDTMTQQMKDMKDQMEKLQGLLSRIASKIGVEDGA